MRVRTNENCLHVRTDQDDLQSGIGRDEMMNLNFSASHKKSFFMTYGVFMLNGIMALSIGSVMPYLREARGLDYVFCGLLVSIHSVGNLMSSFLAGMLPMAIGRKKSILVFNIAYPMAYLLILLCSGRIPLLIAFFLSGIARGASSNYCNSRINSISTGQIWMLNGLHASFSVGALLFPMILSMITRSSDENWIYACVMLLICGIISWVTYFLMPWDDFNRDKMVKKEKGASNTGFFKEPVFYLTTATLFFYLCAEQGVIGWMITYFKDTGLLTGTLSQMTATVQWLMMLIGRLTVAYLSTKVNKYTMIKLMGFFMAVFFVFLLFVKSPVLIMIGIIGFGFSMAGIYPTTVSFAGKLTAEYPTSWSFILTIASFGSILMPSIIGAVAETAGIYTGIATIVIAVVLDVVAILLMVRFLKKEEQN